MPLLSCSDGAAAALGPRQLPPSHNLTGPPGQYTVTATVTRDRPGVAARAPGREATRRPGSAVRRRPPMTAFSKLRGQKGKSHPPYKRGSPIRLLSICASRVRLGAKVSIGECRGWPGDHRTTRDRVLSHVTMLAQGRVRTRVSSGSGVDRYHLTTMTAFSKPRGQKGKSHQPFLHLRQSGASW